MNFKDIEIEKMIPLFTGVLISLLLCAVAAASTPLFRVSETEDQSDDGLENYEDGSLFLSTVEDAQDTVLEYFRNPDYREWVVVFFTGVCSSREIASAILVNADEFDVSPSLAFALCWEESRFNSRAVNRYNRDGSIDRGLFQLNNRSFPNLAVNEFFSVRTNARHGVGHLRYCLDQGGSEVSALAMYNAGTGRVTTTGAPKVTLDYISRILENRSKIENRFHAMLIKEEEQRLEEKQTSESAQPLFNRTLRAASPL